MYDASSYLAYIRENLTTLTWSPRDNATPQNTFLFLLLPRLVSSQTTSLLPPDKSQLPFSSHPLARRHDKQEYMLLSVLLLIAKVSSHFGCPSTGRTPGASEFHRFQCLPTGLTKVNHLWQTAILHQMEQVFHCQSNRTRILQLLSIRNSLKDKKRREFRG